MRDLIPRFARSLLNRKGYRNRNKAARMIRRILMGAHAGNSPCSRWCPGGYVLDHAGADLPVPSRRIDAAPGSAETDIEIRMRSQIRAGNSRDV